jgi:hypothetical protein
VLLLGSVSFRLGSGLLCLCFATAPLLLVVLALGLCRLQPRFFT